MGLKVVDLCGDAFSRGKTYGTVRRELIAAYLSDWFKSLRDACIDDPNNYLTRFIRETDFLTAIGEHSPNFLDEVKGISDGANQSLDLILASQLMDEEWAYRSTALPPMQALQKCSSVAVRSQGSTWVGQNMDLGGYTDGHQVLLRIAGGTSEPGALIFTVGAMIGLMGVSSSGIGVCVNSLPQLPSAREGLPVAFVIRKLLGARDLTEAARAIDTVPHATGQHYLIADASHIRSFEASPEGVVEYCSPDAKKLLHTNHPLAARETIAVPSKYVANTVARLKALSNRLSVETPDLATIQAALSSRDDSHHPVCRVLPVDSDDSSTALINFTTGSMISELREGSSIVDAWVSAGPPIVRGYEHFRIP